MTEDDEEDEDDEDEDGCCYRHTETADIADLNEVHVGRLVGWVVGWLVLGLFVGVVVKRKLLTSMPKDFAIDL